MQKLSNKLENNQILLTNKTYVWSGVIPSMVNSFETAVRKWLTLTFSICLSTSHIKCPKSLQCFFYTYLRRKCSSKSNIYDACCKLSPSNVIQIHKTNFRCVKDDLVNRTVSSQTLLSFKLQPIVLLPYQKDFSQ